MVESGTLDVASFGQRKAQVTRYLEVLELNPTYPLVVGLLEEGELQVIAEYKGQRRVIANISESAYNVDKLLRTHGELKYVTETGESYPIKSVIDYLEVI